MLVYVKYMTEQGIIKYKIAIHSGNTNHTTPRKLPQSDRWEYQSGRFKKAFSINGNNSSIIFHIRSSYRLELL